MVIKNKDFVEIEYTGKVKEGGIVFDTTNEKIAKENEIYNEKMTYGPVVICVGENQVLAGLDKALEEKEVGNDYSVELKPEEAFGKKDAKLIQLIQTSKFLKQNVQPVPGLQVNIDGAMGLVKTVSGGRTLVDFNHPLSGKDVIYDIKIMKLITEDIEKLKAFLKLQLDLKEVDVNIENNEAKVQLKQDIPEEAKKKLGEKIKELIPTITKLDIIKK
jgi:FKBP-type peptidyl-prolyl cis-trans isomerase 2